MLGPLLGLTLSVGGSFFGGVLGKVLKWQCGGPEGGFLCFPSTVRESTGGRGNTGAYSFSLSVSPASQALCPSAFPIKKNLLWGCFPKSSPASFPLHLSRLLWASYIYPVFCLCFNFGSCLACHRKVLWAPGFQLIPYPWPATRHPLSSSPTVVLWPPVHACVLLPGSVVCADVCAWIFHIEGAWTRTSEHYCFGAWCSWFPQCMKQEIKWDECLVWILSVEFFNLCFSYVDC